MRALIITPCQIETTCAPWRVEGDDGFIGLELELEDLNVKIRSDGRITCKKHVIV